MKAAKPNCDGQVRLELLLSGDEDSDEFRVVAQHLDSCSLCQRTLTKLAGQPQEWSEVGELLSDFQKDSADNACPDAAWTASEPEISFDFLDAPSHPEMLGRIGRYEIERVVGAGGMGIVLKGFDSELNRPVAIKVLAPHLSGSGAARSRFEREVRAVVNEHVVAIHNVETEGAVPFLVMQFVPGESLQARVDREGALPPKEVLRIAIQAASGLAAAHEQGVIHRDIKPANILLENAVDRALVTDFGLARTVDDASLTRTGVIAGTPHYMSPEQANADSIDHRADLFSLGAVIYFMATGRPPFRADKAMGVLHRICTDRHRPACEVNSDVPYELSDAIDRLLEKRPGDRVASAKHFREQLSSQLANLQAGLGRRRRDAIRRLARRQWKSIAFVTVAAAVVLGTLAIRTSPTEPRIKSGTQSSKGEPSRPVSPLSASAYGQIVSDPYHAVATRRVYDELGKIENSLETRDGDQLDTRWTAEIERLREQLNQFQNELVEP